MLRLLTALKRLHGPRRNKLTSLYVNALKNLGLSMLHCTIYVPNTLAIVHAINIPYASLSVSICVPLLHLSLYLSVSLSLAHLLFLFVHMCSLSLTFSISVSLSLAHLLFTLFSIYVSVCFCLYLCLTFCLSVSLALCFSVFMYVCLCQCLYLHHFLMLYNIDSHMEGGVGSDKLSQKNATPKPPKKN